MKLKSPTTAPHRRRTEANPSFSPPSSPNPNHNLNPNPLLPPLHLITRLHREEHGTAAVSFILCLPIFLAIVSIIVQSALVLNAKLMVSTAAEAAARAAMTSLPEEVPDNVKKAACFMLVPVSPKAQSGPSADATDIANGLNTMGVKLPDGFAERYTFAEGAVDVEWPQGDYKHRYGEDVEVTVRYKFFLNIPMAMAMLSSKVETVGGVTGRFYTLESKVKVQTAHGRAARSDGGGWSY